MDWKVSEKLERDIAALYLGKAEPIIRGHREIDLGLIKA